MKTLKRFLFFIAGICLLMNCTKDEQLNSGFSGWSGDNFKGHGFGCGEVFVVRPNGTDDTEPLKQAFEDAINAGPGSVVKLVGGNYIIGFIEIREFYGSFIGAGKGKTVITAKTGLDCDAMAGNGLYNYLIDFVGGNTCISDMTIKVTDGTLCSNGNGLDGFLIFADFNTNYKSIDNYVKAKVDNVEFIGYQLGSWWYSPWNALAGGSNTFASGVSRAHIDLQVTNCIFDAFGWGTQFIGVKEGKLILGTNGSGNTFSNCAESVFIWDNINTNVEVVRNTFNIQAGYDGVDFDNRTWGGYIADPQTRATLCNVEGNKFNLEGDNCLGLWLHDHRIVYYPGTELPVLMEVKSNQFNFISELSYGVEMIEGVKAVIRNNKFTGKGVFGFYADALNGNGVWSENCLLLGNNFSTASFSDVALWLGPFTRNFKVVGIGKNTTIRDEGTNNVITEMNFNTHPNPHVKAVIDNMHKMREENATGHHRH
jgi:hypothetical protein